MFPQWATLSSTQCAGPQTAWEWDESPISMTCSVETASVATPSKQRWSKDQETPPLHSAWHVETPRQGPGDNGVWSRQWRCCSRCTAPMHGTSWMGKSRPCSILWQAQGRCWQSCGLVKGRVYCTSCHASCRGPALL
jgi:hypothetical protein